VTRHTEPLEPDRLAEDRRPPAPSRPPAVELAAAILIVGGAIGLAGTVISAADLPGGAAPFVALTIALDVGSVAFGLLIRLGRAWLVALNFAAVLGFVDLLGAGASPLELMLGLAEVVVVVILVQHKPWFDARARWRASRWGRAEPPDEARERRPLDRASALDAADSEATDEIALEYEEDHRHG
jgi:hypothetical protein